MFPVEVKISNAVKLIWGAVLGPLQSNVQGLFNLNDNHRRGNCPEPLVIHHGSYTCMGFFNHFIDIDRVWVCHDYVQGVGGDSHTHTQTHSHTPSHSHTNTHKNTLKQAHTHTYTHKPTHSEKNTHTPSTHTNRYGLKLTGCVCVCICVCVGVCGRVWMCVCVRMRVS